MENLMARNLLKVYHLSQQRLFIYPHFSRKILFCFDTFIQDLTEKLNNQCVELMCGKFHGNTINVFIRIVDCEKLSVFSHGRFSLARHHQCWRVLFGKQPCYVDMTFTPIH